MSRELLDTDILSELMKQKNHRVAERARAYLAAHGRFTTTAVSVMEIAYGFRRVGRDERLVQFESFAAACEVLDFTREAASLAGRIDADLEKRGRPVNVADVMIASIALCANVPVVTGNVTHFEAIREARVRRGHLELAYGLATSGRCLACLHIGPFH